MTTQSSISVPKPLWDELESALMIRSKQLISDLARTLHQDEKLLLHAFRSKKTSLFLIDLDPTTEDYSCSAFVTTTKVAHKCRKPTMFGRTVCPQHEYATTRHDLQGSIHLQRIQSEEPLFLDPLTQLVYNIHYERIGYLHNGKCILFEVDDT